MKKIICSLILLSLFLIVGCLPEEERGALPAGENTERSFGQNHFDLSCTKNSDCFIVDCYGCISKNTDTSKNTNFNGGCIERVPPDCYCLKKNCRSGPVEDTNTSGLVGGNSPNVPPKEEFSFQDFKSKSLPSKPEGELVTRLLGDLEISYFSTAIARGMTESGIDFFMTLENKGSRDVDVYVTPDNELIDDVPKSNMHFFSFQNYPFHIKVGETKKIWYYASVDQPGKFTVNFKLWLGSSSGSKMELPVTFGQVYEDFRTDVETSYVYGYIKDNQGQPVSGKMVSISMNCGRTDFIGIADGDGRYSAKVMAMEDINEIYGEKEVACATKDYFLTFVDDNYGFYFKNNLAPTREQFVNLNITVPTKTEEIYSLQWEKKVEDNYGFFWIKPSADFSVFAVSQAKHPPEFGKPTSFYLFDSNGNILWKQPTNNECWGIDITADGSKVIAACHDGKIYAVDRSGKLLWQFDNGNMARSACFSKDGKKAFSGGLGTLHLFNSETGLKTDVTWIDEWFRNCKFFDDGSFVVGARTIAGFDAAGNKKWDYVIGEFPLFLAIDSSKNVYAAGKSREIFSFDAAGNLRWKQRIPDHTITAGAVTPDSRRIVLGSVGGMIYLYDNGGNLLWKRGTMNPGRGDATVGHNAIAISEDGTRIVAGTAPGNCIVVYDENGSVVWQDCRKTEASSSEYLVGVTNVAISKDKKNIIATYGDNFVRKFVLGELR
ncbi:MAG: PQQ-binding-like beta-propeller repeat protein [Nanoarchaeota archaeon]